MAKHTPQSLIQSVEPSGDEAKAPSAARIKQLALKKRNDHLKNSEEKPMKKVSFQVALIAAIICMLTITAFAAVGGVDYIRSIFGDSTASIQDEIRTPQITAAGGGRELALEAVVTDGFVTNLVVSLTGEKPASDFELFDIESDATLRAISWYDLEEHATADKTFYAVEVVSEKRFDAANMTLVLNKEVAPITMAFEVENHLGNAVIEFPQGDAAVSKQLKELQVSPMGLLLIGYEKNAQGGLPATDIQLIFADGTTEDILLEFAPADEIIGAGGGAVIPGEIGELPLLVSFYGTRNPDGELVISGQFSRIINPAAIEKILVDGAEYPVK